MHHVNVVVPPGLVPETERFWIEVFGGVPLERHGRSGRPGAWLDLGELEVHVSERDGAPHPDAHSALVVDNFAAVRATALERGDPWEDAEPLAGMTDRAFTRDPGGNRVEVLG